MQIEHVALASFQDLFIHLGHYADNRGILLQLVIFIVSSMSILFHCRQFKTVIAVGDNVKQI
jgi:hypothetical protein